MGMRRSQATRLTDNARDSVIERTVMSVNRMLSSFERQVSPRLLFPRMTNQLAPRERLKRLRFWGGCGRSSGCGCGGGNASGSDSTAGCNCSIGGDGAA